ncbi:MAG: hypothetical protein SFU25_07185, partial [Candidatus Caenarcaniphilales bacterium]|nr:hypothetical protein [Candidatus Caenarcaniphilales bacterium]
YFDYSGEKLQSALDKNVYDKNTKFLITSFSSDWLYPSYQSLETVKALQFSGLSVTYCEINSFYGHDAFLLETEELAPIISGFLDK